MCNGFKNVYVYIIFVLLLHLKFSPYLYCPVYTVIKPNVSFRILTISSTYRIHPWHLFFASLSKKKNKIRKKETVYLLFSSGIDSVSQAVRVSTEGDFLHNTTRNTRRPNIPHPPVCVWTLRPCISYKA